MAGHSHRSTWSRGALLLLFVAIAAANVAQHASAAPSRYRAIDLGLGAASDVNNHGEVVGSRGGHAFLWSQASGIVDLGTLGGSSSWAAAVNNRGQVVGQSTTATGEHHSFLWAPDTGMFDLGTLGSGGDYNYALAVSDEGQVVGQSMTTAGEPHAYSWTRAGGMVDLGSLGGDFSEAVDVNADGQVVGYADTGRGFSSDIHAFVWTQAAGILDLGRGAARAISADGRVVGLHAPEVSVPPQPHAFAWTEAGGFVELGSLGGEGFSEARAVNAAGQVVGVSDTDERVLHVFLWAAGGAMTDLGRGYPYAISDSGQVVGERGHAFSWTPEDGFAMLDDFGGNSSKAVAVGDDGTIAGVWTTSPEFGIDMPHIAVWVPLRTQTIDFATLPDRTYGDVPFTVSAIASSGLPVSFSAVGNCTVSASTVTLVGAGSCTVTAEQAGDTSYAAAPPVSRRFSIAKADQTIVFDLLPGRAYGSGPFAVPAAASSGLPVSFAATGNCTVSGATVTLTGAGSCTVTASQPGDANFNAALEVVRTFAVARAAQAIAFAPLPARTYGEPPFTFSASSSSGLPVSFAVTGNCSLSGATVTLTGAGSCTVTASQPGDANFNAALEVVRTFAVARAAQAIAFAPLPSRTYGDPPFTVSASSSSGLPVSFAATGNCSLSGATVTLTGAGSCIVTASQPGNANYEAAPAIARTFAIAGRTCVVPNVAGKKLSAARTAIQQSLCHVGSIKRQTSRRRPKGTVISQSRRPGTRVPEGTVVNLVVSRGR